MFQRSIPGETCGLDRKLEGLLCSSVVDPGPTPLNETLQPRRHADKFMRSAQRELSVAGDCVARVMAILAWIHRNVDYVAGVRDPQTTAEETFADRAGVCRDFNHLGITLCRALGIPARLSVHTRSNRTHRTFTPSSKSISKMVVADRSHTACSDRRNRPNRGRPRRSPDIAFLTTDKQCQVVSSGSKGILEVSCTEVYRPYGEVVALTRNIPRKKPPKTDLRMSRACQGRCG
jgi:Transglutaminase-like superfamily